MICTPESLAANATAGGFTKLSDKMLWAVEAYLDCQIVGGPGGWTPLTPGTAIEWLKADDIQLSNGATVATWPAEVGGPGFGSGSGGPLFITPSQNGLPVVRFNNTGINALTVSGSIAHAQPVTIALAYKYNGPGTNDVIFDGGGATAALGNSGGNLFFSAGTSVTLAASDHLFHILFIVLNGASSKFAFDGAALGAMASNPGTEGAIANNIAVNFNDSVFCMVDIGEIIVWAGDGTSFYSQAFQYLNNRWR